MRYPTPYEASLIYSGLKRGYKSYKSLRMPYLRGTLAKYPKTAPKYMAGPPTLQNQINSLKYQVNQNKHERQWVLFSEVTDTVASTGLDKNTDTITEDLIAGGSFRDQVLGDKWTNELLTINGRINWDQANMARIVVYRPIDPSDEFNPAGLTSNWDPQRVRVYADRYFNPPNPSTSTSGGHIEYYRMVVNLHNLVSVYNSSNTTVKAGNIKVLFMYNSGTAAGDMGSHNVKIQFRNK